MRNADYSEAASVVLEYMILAEIGHNFSECETETTVQPRRVQLQVLILLVRDFPEIWKMLESRKGTI